MSKLCPCTMGNSISQALFGLRDAKKQNCDTPVQTARALVLSRRVRHNNSIYHEIPWLYLVTFRLENGEPLELQTSEATYSAMKEGSTWQITWQDACLTAYE